MPSPVPPSMPVSGRRTGEVLWLTERSMTGFGSAPARDSGFRSTCTASATPPRLSGPSAIQRTCAEQRIFSAIRPLEQRKSTTSWRSPVSRVGPSLEPLGILGNNIRRGKDGLYAGGACAILSAVCGGQTFPELLSATYRAECQREAGQAAVEAARSHRQAIASRS